MERDDLASLAGFFLGDGPLAARTTATLDEEAAHHARVRRLDVGDRVYLADGAGAQGTGRITSLGKKQVEIAIDDVRQTAALPPVHMIVPVADRDRMLWCAEKCTELAASSWRPILWNRSRSVSPRGEGAAFHERVRGRMRSALIQAHAPWLPQLPDEASLDVALRALPSAGSRLVLDVAGPPIAREPLLTPITIAVGPEGGIEPTEMQLLSAASFRPVSLGANVLRFETAAVAALAIVRAALAAPPETTDG